MVQLPAPMRPAAASPDTPKPRTATFFFLCSGFFSMMTVSSYLEEMIFKSLPGFDYYWSVAFVELAVFCATGVVLRHWQEPPDITTRKPGFLAAPQWLYMVIGLLLASHQGVGKVVYRYLNYTTGMMLKSMKLVPTLVFSTVWLRRTHRAAEWAAALLLVTSASSMVLGEARVAGLDFNPVGLLVAAAGLGLALLQTLLQDKALRDWDAPLAECSIWTNAFGALAVVVVMATTGELPLAAAFFMSSPWANFLLILRSVTFSAGSFAQLAMIKEFGAVSATAVGTSRKVVSVIVSLTLFPKPLTSSHLWGMMLFVVADLFYLCGHVFPARNNKETSAEKPNSLKQDREQHDTSAEKPKSIKQEVISLARSCAFGFSSHSFNNFVKVEVELV